MGQLGGHRIARPALALAMLLLLAALACDVAGMLAFPSPPTWLAAFLLVAATIAAIWAVVVNGGHRDDARPRERLLSVVLCGGYLCLLIWRLLGRADALFEADGGYFVLAAVTLLLSMRRVWSDSPGARSG